MGLVCELIFGRITHSKHFANIAVRVTGRRSLSTFGRGFLFTGIISPIFHRFGMRQRSRDMLKML